MPAINCISVVLAIGGVWELVGHDASLPLNMQKNIDLKKEHKYLKSLSIFLLFNKIQRNVI
jgi:hypothetical protein